MSYADLVVTRKAIHKQENRTRNTLIDDLIDKQSGIVVFWTCAIDVAVIGNIERGVNQYSFQLVLLLIFQRIT